MSSIRVADLNARALLPMVALVMVVSNPPAATAQTAGVTEWTRQAGIAMPRVEFGADVTALPMSRWVPVFGPRVTLNLSRRTAIDIAADLQIRRDASAGRGSTPGSWKDTDLYSVQIRRTLYPLRSGGVFGTIGGGALHETSFFPGFSYQTFPGVQMVVPAQTSRSTTLTILTGFGVDHQIAARLAVRVAEWRRRGWSGAVATA